MKLITEEMENVEVIVEETNGKKKPFHRGSFSPGEHL
jgi:hypothetical protein